MDFQLDDNQTQIRDALTTFCRAEIEAQALLWDESTTFPTATFAKLAELGMLGVLISEERGGVGLGLVELATVCERLGHADAGLASVFAGHAGACAYLLGHPALGAQAHTWLADAAMGETRLAWADRERIDAGSKSTGVAARQSSNRWSLSGEKHLVVGAQWADLLLVTAHVAGGEKLFAVKRDASGLSVKAAPSLGLHSAAMASVHFDGVDAISLTSDDDATDHLERVRQVAQISLAAVASGVGARAVELSASYALERKQFGKPIAEFQAIQHRISDATMGVESARLLMWRAASAFGSGRSAAAYAAMAYTASTQAAFKAGDHGIQIHGGYGYVREYIVERLWRDARVLCTLGGTHHDARDHIARQLLA